LAPGRRAGGMAPPPWQQKQEVNMLLTPEKIKQAIQDARRRNPGKILSAMEIYTAIAQAQYNEDMKEEKQ